MKVIFLKDIPRVGRRYDVKEVSDGYARNFLFPQKAVEIATPAALSALKKKKAETEGTRKVREDLLLKNLEDIKNARVTIKAKMNEKGHLFASIHNNEITNALKAQTGLSIDPSFIDLTEPVKTMGEHTIIVNVGNKKERFTLIVEGNTK